MRRAVTSLCFLWVLVLTTSLARNSYYTNNLNDADEYDNVCTKKSYKEVVTHLPSRYFDGLLRIEANEVGERKSLKIEGRTYHVITRAIQPPIFEIPDYLSTEECDSLISIALSKGLKQSKTTGEKNKPTNFNKAHNSSDKTRVSKQAWLYLKDDPDQQGILYTLRNRLYFLTGLSRKTLGDSEPLQVARYTPGGHYHAHLDSEETQKDSFEKKSCCYQTFNRYSPCLNCRYMTVMYYLTDVEHGGETAFIKAKLHADQPEKEKYSKNLSKDCSDANLLIKPRKGSVVFWYNHFVDPVTGWLGQIDPNTLHGGCDVIQGEKWIANNWINVPPYKDLYLDSKYRPMLFDHFDKYEKNKREFGELGQCDDSSKQVQEVAI